MKKSQNMRAAIVGLFVVIGLLFFMGGIFMVGSLHKTFNSNIEVVSFFEDVEGLQKGNNIWFMGVIIGIVNDVRFSEASKVEVSMNIDINAQEYIHKNARVKISSDGLIGNKILKIYGGSADYSEVQNGDVLMVDKSFSTEDMMNTLQENNKNILAITTDFKVISKKIAEGEGTIGKLLNDDLVQIENPRSRNVVRGVLRVCLINHS